MAKKKRKKKSTKKKLKDQAWKLFSRYVRLRDSDDEGFCNCVTCGVKDYWKNMQAGHAIGGRTNALLFDEEIVNAQCRACNIFRGGQYEKYAIVMIDRHGLDKYRQMVNKKHEIKRFTEKELYELVQKFKELGDALEAVKT